MYIAVERFADLQDGKRIYEAGEEFPRPGLAVSADRIAELAGSNNREGRALIKATETPVEAAPKRRTQSTRRGGRRAKKPVSEALGGRQE